MGGKSSTHDGIAFSFENSICTAGEIITGVLNVSVTKSTGPGTLSLRFKGVEKTAWVTRTKVEKNTIPKNLMGVIKSAMSHTQSTTLIMAYLKEGIAFHSASAYLSTFLLHLATSQDLHTLNKVRIVQLSNICS